MKIKSFLAVFCLSIWLPTLHAAAAGAAPGREPAPGMHTAERQLPDPGKLPLHKATPIYPFFRWAFSKALRSINNGNVKDIINGSFGRISRCNRIYIFDTMCQPVFTIIKYVCTGTCSCEKEKYRKYMIDHGGTLLREMVACVNDLDNNAETKLPDRDAVEFAATEFYNACCYLFLHDYEHYYEKYHPNYPGREFPKYLPAPTVKTAFDVRLGTNFWHLVLEKMGDWMKRKEKQLGGWDDKKPKIS